MKMEYKIFGDSSLTEESGTTSNYQVPVPTLESSFKPFGSKLDSEFFEYSTRKLEPIRLDEFIQYGDKENLHEQIQSYKEKFDSYHLEKRKRTEEDFAQEFEYSNMRSKRGIKIIDYTETKNTDKDEYLTYTPAVLSRRSDLTSDVLYAFVEKDPKVVIYFEDTKTILIPEDDMLTRGEEVITKRRDNGEDLIYNELDFQDLISYKNDQLFPISACLEFPSGRGSGSVSFGYSSTIELNAYIRPTLERSFSIGWHNFSITIGFGYGFSVSAGKSMSIEGSHSCDTKDGKALRLFYSPTTIQARPRHRNIIFTFIKNMMFTKEWKQLEQMTYLMEQNPIYYCATEDKMDLKCDVDSHIQYDRENNQFNNT
ncbi:uncharacterized protein RJT21DRAFT_133669 [Scheffersomyces amazonensis]|uniref:uncharacterized protein n=1 Tax=Scheffersomyces amazonensis TaxID=1078765 RepID=UPI00315CB7EF